MTPKSLSKLVSIICFTASGP